MNYIVMVGGKEIAHQYKGIPSIIAKKCMKQIYLETGKKTADIIIINPKNKEKQNIYKCEIEILKKPQIITVEKTFNIKINKNKKI